MIPRATCASPPCGWRSGGSASANPEIQAAVIKKIDDQNWAVREQLAATLGVLPAGPRETAIAMLLERYADDPDRDGRGGQRPAWP